ncbi:Putative Hydroxylase [Kitasatospora sp. MMS16-BH015]|uniref:2OG-Fe(II) oxygenase n=1 Tax=Kitasatospora sp. MMS16-BH015 TaxID=2018025 RepID=UPI000CA299BB|nr:2OG-Fe(II) oxygenase [Kitasatospora sp. MMS16-BH015]AUG78269.1 Putative Hydroxylase [Kitasatospora sp. MMS16-BH015]
MLSLDAPLDTRTEPYRWALAQDLLPAGARARLRADLPELDAFRRIERAAGGDKQYGMYVLPLVSRGEPLPGLAQAGPAWRELAESVLGGAYRAWVEEAVGAETADCPIDLGVFVFGPGDGVSPHTDKADKWATHVFYLNEEWCEADGGSFQVRADPSPGSPPVASVVPGGGRSVVFARSDASWHAVAPIAPTAPEYRYTVQVEMWR